MGPGFAEATISTVTTARLGSTQLTCPLTRSEHGLQTDHEVNDSTRNSLDVIALAKWMFALYHIKHISVSHKLGSTSTTLTWPRSSEVSRVRRKVEKNWNYNINKVRFMVAFEIWEYDIFDVDNKLHIFCA